MFNPVLREKIEIAPPLHTGTVKFYNGSRGWGFLCGDNGEAVFFSITHVEGKRLLRKGKRVSYQIEQEERGPAARRVKAL